MQVFKRSRRRGANQVMGVLVLLFGLVACGGNNSNGSSEDDDTMEMTSTNNESMSTCSPACEEGSTCQNGTCVAASGNNSTPMVTGSAVGAECTTNETCAEDLCLTDESIPGGYCSKVCGTGLPGADDSCPTGSSCIQIGDGVSACLDSCGADSECRSGYVCEAVGSESVCLPMCQSDYDCGLDEVCQSGRCEVTNAGGTRVGGSCAEDSTCQSSVCLTEADTDWPGGTCVGDCTGSADGSFCDGVTADSGLCINFDEVGLCFPSCTTALDCRNGYVCSADDGIANEDGYGVCFPHCEFTGCEDGTTCDVSGFCVESQVNEPQEVLTTNLGVYDLNNQYYQTLEFDIPEDAVSFAITMVSENGVTVPSLDGLYGPTGRTIFNIYDPLQSAMKFFGSEGTPLGFVYPNTPALNVNSGTYTMEVSAYSSSQVTIYLHVKKGSVPQMEKMPLTMWFMYNDYLDATTAQTDPKFQQAVSEMRAIYASAGIDISPIQYRDVHEDIRYDYASVVLDDSTSVEGMISAAFAMESTPVEGANLLFNDQLFLEDGGVLYGISAGLPGPVGVNNTQTLGVFVALDTHADQNGELDASELGSTMGHELGHYLGLYHVSEADGSSHDPLNDTPECGASRDANRDGILSGDECDDAAASNMMFWTSSEFHTQNQLSAAQGWVLHRNPVITQ